MPVEIQNFRFYQPAKSFPMVDRSNLSDRICLIDQVKDGWEMLEFIHCTERQRIPVLFPFIGSNPMLLRSGPHDHGSPVGRRAGWQNRTGMQGVTSLRHQPVHIGCFGHPDPIRAHAVHTNDQNMAKTFDGLALYRYLDCQETQYR